LIALVLVGLLSIPQATHSSQSTIDVALLVDVSDSMTLGPFQRDGGIVAEAADAVAQRLIQGDIARIGTFGSQISMQHAVADPASLRLAASQLRARIGGSSPIWDAIAEAATALSNESGRRGIIVITDGRATGNRLGFEELLERLKLASLPVFVVSIDPWSEKLANRTRPNPDPGTSLERLARTTGGICIFVERKALLSALVRTIDSLRER
jgi:Mg-chelatase subunit ChlD